MRSPEASEIVLQVEGMRFHALALGPEAGELVLLLHGFPQFADCWLPVMRGLAEAGYRAVAVDQRGYSPEARPGSVAEYSLVHLVADVLGFADALGARSFHVVGHDWGGVVAWQVAADYPARLRTVTVLAMPHLSAFSSAVRSNLDQMYRSKYILLFKAPGHLAERLLLAFNARLLRGVYQGKPGLKQVEANVRRLSQGGALRAALSWYRALSPTQRTGKVRVSTLYVWGDRDVALGEKAALDTARYVEGPYRFVRVEGGSHWLVEEAPERMTALVLQHLTGSVSFWSRRKNREGLSDGHRGGGCVCKE